jgi:hypothetical protein
VFQHIGAYALLFCFLFGFWFTFHFCSSARQRFAMSRVPVQMHVTFEVRFVFVVVFETHDLKTSHSV